MNNGDVVRFDEPLPRAHRWEMFSCGDPQCGPHLIAFDCDDEPMVEIVIGLDHIDEVIAALKEIAAQKHYASQHGGHA